MIKQGKYLLKLLIAYPTAFFYGLTGNEKGFDKLMEWLMKDQEIKNKRIIFAI